MEQQGITLNRIEDNVVSGRNDVGRAKKETQKAASTNRKNSLIQRLKDGEAVMVSLAVCFVFVVILFLVDVSY